jgi:MFS family permease
MEPSEMQLLMSYVGIPWTIKIVYGIVSDNFPICGSHRRSYIFIGSIMQIISSVALALSSYPEYDKGPYFAIAMLTVGSMAVAMGDVIVDSLMVIQSRRFPDDGSEELQTFSWTCLSLGGAVGAVISALLADNFPASYSFFGTAFIGLLMAILVANTNSDIEDVKDSNEGEEKRSCIADVKKNLSEIKEALQVPEFYKLLIYYLLKGFMVPRFGTFGYYF